MNYKQQYDTGVKTLLNSGQTWTQHMHADEIAGEHHTPKGQTAARIIAGVAVLAYTAFIGYCFGKAKKSQNEDSSSNKNPSKKGSSLKKNKADARQLLNTGQM